MKIISTKKLTKKIISILLAVMLTISTCFMAAGINDTEEIQEVSNFEFETLENANIQELANTTFSLESVTDSLAVVIKDLLETVVCSDSIINMIVQMLYPMVDEQFSAIAFPDQIYVPVLHSIKTEYNYTIDAAVVGGGLAITPIALATVLTQGGYAQYSEAIAALELAGTDWQSEAIYDAQTDTLTLNWGVDEAVAAIESGESTASKVDVFTRATGAALQGMYPILGALLCGDMWEITVEDFAIASGIVDVELYLYTSANDGYINAFAPIYEMLGYSGYATAEQISEIITNSTEFVQLIFTDIYAAIDEIVETPLADIQSLITEVETMLSSDSLNEILSNLKIDFEYVARTFAVNTYSNKVSMDMSKMLDIDAIEISIEISEITDFLMEYILDNVKQTSIYSTIEGIFA
ncbi:MAG: hypothetical protein R3Y27_04220 [Clostridia bacterium]